MEMADALAQSSCRHSVSPFIHDLVLDPKVRIIHASQDLFERGLQLYDQRQDKGWTLTDCISFVLMADEKMTDALTGDRHFEQAGFKALLL
jgi:predicted nucleic acid-binding protein